MTMPGDDVEGLDQTGGSWGDYPLDDLLIRQENRTIHDVIRRIDQSSYVMDPDFQRDFIWPEDKCSVSVCNALLIDQDGWSLPYIIPVSPATVPRQRL